MRSDLVHVSHRLLREQAEKLRYCEQGHDWLEHQLDAALSSETSKLK